MRHPAVPHPAETEAWSQRFADKMSAAFGSMGMLWGLVAWQLGWMTLAGLGFWLFAKDQYPFSFLLLLSNLIQLWALPLLGSTANRADAKRAAKADADHAALAYLATRVDAIAAALDIPKQ